MMTFSVMLSILKRYNFINHHDWKESTYSSAYSYSTGSTLCNLHIIFRYAFLLLFSSKRYFRSFLIFRRHTCRSCPSCTLPWPSSSQYDLSEMRERYYNFNWRWNVVFFSMLLWSLLWSSWRSQTYVSKMWRTHWTLPGLRNKLLGNLSFLVSSRRIKLHCNLRGSWKVETFRWL